ncbi:ABC transporter permease [Arthrobacter roseus]|uniref:ABC transporter permease n=1 Tax=Arthrobacter roseus TaxID=136274 RepID=UPI001966C22E|nr:ABC transporter permease [Arthrobacter roseus]MBM7847960.1 simple sugar transport system permease protein [Arthrobacter roseus]
MSTATAESHAETTTPHAVVRNWKAPVGFGIGALVSLLVFAIGSPAKTAIFRISADDDRFRLQDVHLPATTVGWVVTIALTALAVYAFLQVRKGVHISRWAAAAYALFFVTGFLTWVVGSANTPSISLGGLVAGSVTLAVPLIFGSMSGVLCERSGVVNIAIEGQLLSGAFAAAVAGSISGSAFVGLIAAALAGMLVSVVLAMFSIKYFVNQIIVGVVLNVLVSGVTGFLASTLLSRDPQVWNNPPRLPDISIPLLSDIPIIGPILFKQSIVGYLMYIIVIVIYLGLYYTKWGLRLRAVGEHPQAADTVGINVNRWRFWNVVLGGGVAGLGGAFYTLVAVSSFTPDMTAGQGYIALAALIFGRWNPIGAFFASLLFGFATNLQYVLSIVGTSVPSQFLAMLPYIVTILAVAGLVGKSRAPAASGIPYVKE